MKTSNKLSPKAHGRGLKRVQEDRGEHLSLWTALESTAPEAGCVPQTRHAWVDRVAARSTAIPVGPSFHISLSMVL